MIIRQYHLLTWLEEHDGLEAGELSGVDGQSLEAAEDLLQEPQVQAGVAGLPLHAGAEVRQGEQRAAVQGQRPLDGTQEEELAPRLLQQDHLFGGKEDAQNEALFPPFTYKELRREPETKIALITVH